MSVPRTTGGVTALVVIGRRAVAFALLFRGRLLGVGCGARLCRRAVAFAVFFRGRLLGAGGGACLCSALMGAKMAVLVAGFRGGRHSGDRRVDGRFRDNVGRSLKRGRVGWVFDQRCVGRRRCHSVLRLK